MKILRFDSVGGASGDMILGALADLGADLHVIEHALADLHFGPVGLEAARVVRHGLTGIELTVHTDDGAGHSHAGDTAAHTHHAHAHAHAHAHTHAHRAWRDIRSLLEHSALPSRARANALNVFARLAAAEGGIHGQPVDDVRFHEVGAADSIADTVGACLALEQLGIDAVECGPLPLGTGTVTCAHGVYPLPAPATAALLKGFPVIAVDETKETVTPTGAALLVEWCAALPSPEPGARRIRAIGYGFGHRELAGRPNVLRATLFESDVSGCGGGTDECLVLEAEMDDCTGEWMGALTAKLMESGALDVYTTAVQMKKGRPGMLLSVLCRAEQRDVLLDVIFRGGTTLGVREYMARRTVLERRIDSVATPFGDVRIKVGIWKGVPVVRAPEMDDCIALAAEHGASARAVYEAAAAAANRTPR